MGLFDKLLTPDRKRWSGRQVVWSIDPITGLLEEAAADQVAFSSQPDEARQEMSTNGEDSGPESSFGVREAAKRIGCSPGLVRKFVHSGELPHHWVGKNLRFRYSDLEEFWASQTRHGADKTSSGRLSGETDLKKRDSERKRQKQRQSVPIPTRREVDRLWQS